MARIVERVNNNCFVRAPLEQMTGEAFGNADLYLLERGASCGSYVDLTCYGKRRLRLSSYAVTS